MSGGNNQKEKNFFHDFYLKFVTHLRHGLNCFSGHPRLDSGNAHDVEPNKMFWYVHCHKSTVLRLKKSLFLLLVEKFQVCSSFFRVLFVLRLSSTQVSARQENHIFGLL